MFKAGDFRSIGDFGKTTEFTQMSGVMEEDKQEGICGDGEEALYNQSPKHGFKRVFTVSARGSIVMKEKRSRDNFIKVNMVFKKRQELGLVGIENISAIFKNICQRELIIWYHVNTSPFWWVG